MAGPIVAIIAPGAMGSAVGARLVERDIDVITSLAGRSRSSSERAERSGMRPAPDAEIAKAAFILSIVPPSTRSHNSLTRRPLTRRWWTLDLVQANGSAFSL